MGFIHDNNIIAVPESMKDRVLQWYYLMQLCPGEKDWNKQIVYLHLERIENQYEVGLQALLCMLDEYEHRTI